MDVSSERLLEELRERLTRPAAVTDAVSEIEILTNDTTSLWRAGGFTGPDPWFYPVYRCGDLYSYSPLPLLLHKGRLELDEDVRASADTADFRSFHSNATLDRTITRIGKPLPLAPRQVDSPSHFAQGLARAIADDVAAIESKFPGYTNVIFTGGKDSQNLALLPWKNPVIVASGAPNDVLNEQFIANNRLPHELVPLELDDLSHRDLEILANLSASSLAHKRWVPHIVRLTRELGGRVLFWSGQMADGFTTDLWRRYDPQAVGPNRQFWRVLRRVERSRLRPLTVRLDVPRRRLFRSFWYRGAMGEGHHMGLLRAMTGCPSFSAYQGPAATALLASTDFEHAIDDNLRVEVGRLIAGGDVWYPDTNPGPAEMVGKEDWHRPGHLLPLLERIEVTVE